MTQNNRTQKGALVNSTTDTQKSRLRERGQTEPGLVTLFDIRPGNGGYGAGLFLQPGAGTGPKSLAEPYIPHSVAL